jgi:hypothetical protein
MSGSIAAFAFASASARAAVVRHDVLPIGRERSDFRPGDRVERVLSLDDENALAGGLKLAFGERFQQLGGLRIAFGDERPDRFDLFVAVAEGELLDRRRVQRVSLEG